jgi:hypothetical protein
MLFTDVAFSMESKNKCVLSQASFEADYDPTGTSYRHAGDSEAPFDAFYSRI